MSRPYGGIKNKAWRFVEVQTTHFEGSRVYGYCSLIKATKQVIDKLDLENKTFTKITSRERKENRLWHPIALREAVINAMVHNDYSREIPPKFEIFDDRIEITSSGGLPLFFDEEEFFEGFSNPINRELMRIYKDLDMVEHLGSGIPRILEFYSKNIFHFTSNFLRMTFNSASSIGGSIGGSIVLTSRQEEIFSLLLNNNRLSYRKISLLLGINESAVKKHLNILKEKGLLQRVGGTRGYWLLKLDS